MSGFGNDDPREMPAHFFYRSLRVNYETAVRSIPFPGTAWHAGETSGRASCHRESTRTAAGSRTRLRGRKGRTCDYRRRWSSRQHVHHHSRLVCRDPAAEIDFIVQAFEAVEASRRAG
jgi:hypothetical protein